MLGSRVIAVFAHLEEVSSFPEECTERCISRERERERGTGSPETAGYCTICAKA